MRPGNPAQWSLRSPLRSVECPTSYPTAHAPLWAGRAKHIKVPSSQSNSHSLVAGCWLLVSELALPGKDHRHPALVGGGDHLGVVHRSARLHDRTYTSGRRLIHAVAEGEVSVGAEHS